MSFRVYNTRQKATRASEFDDASEKAAEFIDETEFDEESGFDGDNGTVPSAYEESEWETTTVRCCGAFACVLLGTLVLSWIVHAIPISTVTDIPPFARSMIWMSIAHHTDAWKAQQGSISPPPPAFGDGLGNFPDS